MSNSSRNKATCPQCGYEVTLLKKWASYGAPICPKDSLRMVEAIPETIENTTRTELVAEVDEIRRAIS